MPEAEQGRKNQRHAGHRQTFIHLPHLAGLLLPLILGHVEICQPDQCRQGEEHQDRQIQRPVQTACIADHRRQKPEAHQIRQGVDLDAELLLCVRALPGTSHLAVEHITESCQQQQDDADARMTGQRIVNAAAAACKPRIGEQHRVIVKSYHEIPFNSFIPGGTTPPMQTTCLSL